VTGRKRGTRSGRERERETEREKTSKRKRAREKEQKVERGQRRARENERERERERDREWRLKSNFHDINRLMSKYKKKIAILEKKNLTSAEVDLYKKNGGKAFLRKTDKYGSAGGSNYDSLEVPRCLVI